MPSFLSKVFGRKKDDKEPSAGRRTSTTSLLEGKFEGPDKLPEAKDKEKGKEIGFGLLRTKSATPVLSTYAPSEVPHLSLNLPGPKNGANTRSLGVVFEADPDSQILLSQSEIGGRRLNPLETLILVRACSQAIVARGLETPGLMHPHWYSADPQVQKRLISLFIHSLAPKSPITTLSPTLSSPTSAFESEITSTRSPHDVAAVLRWGVRHLQLDGNSFGKDQAWYKNFFNAESSSQYPLTAFEDGLVPQLPPAHLELLTATLDLFSYPKLLGLWLLDVTRAEPSDTWSSFYARWERAGRMMEHIFLSNIRREMAKNRMPKRLTELVKQYPYSKSPTEEDLLPRPWRLAPSPGGYSATSRVFADETIRFLSMIPMEKATSETPTLNLFDLQESDHSPLTGAKAAVVHKLVSVMGSCRLTCHSVPASTSTPSPASHIGVDWAQFSTSGFLESLPLGTALASTLMDSDLEVTVPPEPKKSKSPTRRNVPELNVDINKAMPKEETNSTSKVTSVSSVQLDEAFIDFWNDALVDPISSDWPSFVICKLKGSLSDIEIEGKRVEWIVLEQTFSKPPPPLPPASDSLASPSVESPGKRPRASSPKPSFKSDISGTFSSTKKRFSFWTGGDNKSPTKRKNANIPKSPKIGEMGEILKEEDGDKVKTKATRKSVDVPKDIPEERESEGGVSGTVATTAAAVTAVGATAVLVQAAAEAAPGELKVAEAVAVPKSAPNQTPISESTVDPAPPPVVDPIPATAPVDEAVTTSEVKVEEASVTEFAPAAAVPVEVPPPVLEGETLNVEEPLASEPVPEVISPSDVAPVLEEAAAPTSESESAPVPSSIHESAPLTVQEPVIAPTEESVAIPEEELASVPVEEPAITSVEEPVIRQAEQPPVEEESVKDIAPTEDAAPAESAAAVPVEGSVPAPVDQSAAPSVTELTVKNAAPVEHVADLTEEPSLVVQPENVIAPVEEQAPLSPPTPVTTDVAVASAEELPASAPEEQGIAPIQAEELVSLPIEEKDALPTAEEDGTAVQEKSGNIGATAPAEEVVETSSTDPEVVGGIATPIVEDNVATHHPGATFSESVPAPTSPDIKTTSEPDVAAATQPEVFSVAEPETVAPASDPEDKPLSSDVSSAAEPEDSPQEVSARAAPAPEEEPVDTPLLVEKPAVDIVPVADEPTATEPSVVHTEPLRESTSEPQEKDTISLPPVPVVDAEPPSPAFPVIEEIREPQVEAHSEPLSPDVKAELPPAPASVILSGETPGPSVLSTQTIIQASSTEHDILSNGSLSNDVENVAHEKAHTGSDKVESSDPVTPPGLYTTLTPEKESNDSNDNSQENGHLLDS
ncbi:hypothetical protein EV421DRAFT_1833687 [Armillaria borealis]|uniref:Meiotically up-regulated protein Msb1/Mug8 domain-containing protein n=1 Tax=Armillaria borealis TaxID=47425 RepID=A0AA39MIE8_9AGAR|nr:hypothetical protein EV421DRAFT_1833687 [Armillaria borealis]